MDGKLKILVGACVGIAALAIGFTQVSKMLDKDPVITGLEAEFVGEVGPGKTLSKDMFEVKGVTDSGKLVAIKDFSSKTTKAAENGATCEIELESQGYTTTAIVNITRKPVFTQDIGYPNEKSATVTCYSNGDLEFSGSGQITNFSKDVPWEDCDYTHVYIDEALEIENMDYWFEGNKALVYCDDLPKTVKTIKNTFAGCSSLERTPDYFQCSNLKIFDYAFSGCTALKEADMIPVNATSLKYTFEKCTALQNPISLDKATNLMNVSGLYNGCTNLREAVPIPDSVTDMKECYKDCINIKEAVKFPANVQDISSAYQGSTALMSGASIPESVIDFTNCYKGCSALCGNLEINSDTSKFAGALSGASTNGDRLSISGNSGNLLAIQKDAENPSIVLDDPEAAAQQNERMLREQEVMP